MGEEIHLAIKIVMYRVLKNRLFSSRVSLLDNAPPQPSWVRYPKKKTRK